MTSPPPLHPGQTCRFSLLVCFFLAKLIKQNKNNINPVGLGSCLKKDFLTIVQTDGEFKLRLRINMTILKIHYCCQKSDMYVSLKGNSVH